MARPARTAPSATASWWVVAAAAVISGMLAYVGFTTGEWRGVAITEVQILVVAAVTYVGLR
ncbi:MAG TPA: hypothetical protein VFD92_01670 [Candidatus Binatia bacterium]|nr:hypothetical protein [Candidatus Binatia bacterium]